MALNLDGIRPVYLIAGGAVVLALLWVSSKGAAGVGASIGSGAVDLVGGVLTGAATSAKAVVVSGGSSLLTAVSNNQTACDAAVAAGDSWGVFANCPLKDISTYVL